MCGIWGFLTSNPHESNSILFQEMCDNLTHRGLDATGIAVKEDAAFNVVKAGIPADIFMKKFWGELEDKVKKATVTIGHVRASTIGHEKDNNNNHPIFSKRFLLTHNGMVANQRKIEEYGYKGDVDTEIIISYLETKNNIIDALAATAGSAALAFVDMADKTDHIYLFCRNQDAYACFDEATNTFFWSSEDDVFDDLPNIEFLGFIEKLHFVKIPENKLYKIYIMDGKIEGECVGDVPISPEHDQSTWKHSGYTASSRQALTRSTSINYDRDTSPSAWSYDFMSGHFIAEYDRDNIIDAAFSEIEEWPKEKWEFDEESFTFKNNAYVEQMRYLCIKGITRKEKL